MKECGILIALSMLNNKYGIGSLGSEVYKLIDDMVESKQKYLQILPLGQTGYGDSPYQTFSYYAGSVYYIDLEMLVEEGLLKSEDLITNDSNVVDYSFLYKTRWKILKKAYSNFVVDDSYNMFINNHWLDDYSLFMSLKEVYKCNWHELPINLKFREKQCIEEFKENYNDLIEFYKFTQYIFFKQWYSLKHYANNKGIKIIGDMPIYASYDSSDVYSYSSNYLLETDLSCSYVAGCPSDDFCLEGQYWGNPLYDWEYIKENKFNLFKKRFDFNLQMYDVIRIDHFRGYSSYFKIKANDKPINGEWCMAYGKELFDELKLDVNRVIIEDLGHISDDVIELVKYTKFSNMNVCVFGLDNKSVHLPNNYTKDCIAYSTTHDNIPINGLLKTLNESELDFLYRYYNHNICSSMIRHLYKSKARLVVISIADLLGLGIEATLNIPNTLNNWTYKLPADFFSNELKEKLINLVSAYNR